MTKSKGDGNLMRVCMLSYSQYESDTRVQQYAMALAERGDAVDVIALRDPGQSGYELVNGVNVYRIQQRTRSEKGLFSYAYKILAFLFLSAIFITRKHLARPYQVLHIHSVPDFLVLAALVPKLTGAVVVLDIHDILPEFYASKFGASQRSLMFKLLLLVEKWSTALSDYVIVANHIWHQRLVGRALAAEKCTPICNYPDPQFFYRRPKTRADGKFIIMYPGTLNYHQGLDIAVRAFARVAGDLPEAEFHIYGEGPTKNELMRLSSELKLEGKVLFKKFVNTAEIAKLMGEADLAIVPKRATLFGNEAQSTKVLEFMAVGVPVIKTRTKIGAYYHDESRLKFFESENVDDLAQCILTLRRDQPFRERLVANAEHYVAANNWGVKKQEYLDVVDRLVVTRIKKRTATPAAGVCENPSARV